MSRSLSLGSHEKERLLLLLHVFADDVSLPSHPVDNNISLHFLQEEETKKKKKKKLWVNGNKHRRLLLQPKDSKGRMIRVMRKKLLFSVLKQKERKKHRKIKKNDTMQGDLLGVCLVSSLPLLVVEVVVSHQ